MNTDNTNANPSSGRDNKGRFTIGNLGGPGNPFARKVAALRQALIDSVTPADIQAIAASLIQRAKEGNVQAAKLLLSYSIGKPQPAPEPDRLDADEWNVYKETMDMKDESPAMIKAGPSENHVRYVRAGRPTVGFLWDLEMRKMFNEGPEETRPFDKAAAAECERILNTPVELPDVPDDPLPNAPKFEPKPNGGKRPESSAQKSAAIPEGEADDRLQPSTNGKLHGATA